MLWVLLLLLLACSGIVSASETALFGLSRSLLAECGRSARRWRHRIHVVMQHPHRTLMTVLIANTTVNVAIFTVAYFALRHLRETVPYLAVGGSAMVPLLVIVFGEMLPKAVVLTSPMHFAPLAAALVSALHLVFGPVHWLLGRTLIDPVTRLFAPQQAAAESVTPDELRLLVEHSVREGTISTTENEMLQAVVALAEVSVRVVMTPRVDIVSVALDADRASAEQIIRSSQRRRLPVRGRDLDDLRGILYARDFFLHPDRSVRQLMRRAEFVPEQVSLMQLLRHFRTAKIEMAVVVDEYGGTAGLVTIEDIVGWIVGELPDAESPRPTAMTERLDENTYRVSGDLSVRLWADRFAAGKVERGIDTVAGLILAFLGRIPQSGDSVEIGNLILTVEKMNGRRIEQVLLKRRTPETASTGAPQSQENRR